MLCAWLCGSRLTETRNLRWSPSEKFAFVDFDRNRIVLPAAASKNGKDDWLPLSPTLRQALESLPRSGDEVFPFRNRYTGKPLSRNGITSRILKMAKRAGVKLSMHRLRKGFGCALAKQYGRGGALVLHRLRHSSMQVTMDFYASVDDVLQEAIKGLDVTANVTSLIFQGGEQAKPV